MIVGLVAGLVAAVLFGAGAVVQAHAVRRLETSPERLAGFMWQSVRDPWTVLVVVGYLVGFVLHAVAIWLLPLYLAQAAIALSLPVTALGSTLLRERLTPMHWWAVVVVTAGLVLLAAGSGHAGAVVTTPVFVVILWLGVLVLAAAARAGVGVSGGLLGWLSGLGYAGSAVAVRGVEASISPLVVAAALAVPLYGLLAFWLYSLALDRAGVSAATAPLIVGETFVPALAGVLLLGDGVRVGWWPAVTAGLALATLGAIQLSRGGSEVATGR